MAPRHVPWWRVDCDTDESDKLARLPNDSARWAWFRAGCRAKTQRRMGVFAGSEHLATLLGRHGRYIPDLIRVGSLHVWPTDCARCVDDYAGEADAGDIVVHDYRRKQSDPTSAQRQSRHRLVTASSRDSHADSHGVVTSVSRALSQSPSQSPSREAIDEPYPVSGGGIEEPYATLEQLTRYPVQRFEPSAIRAIDALIDRRGIEAVLDAAHAVAPTLDPQPPAPWPLVAAIRNRLEPIARNGSAPKPRKGYMPRQEDLDALAG